MLPGCIWTVTGVVVVKLALNLKPQSFLLCFVHIAISSTHQRWRGVEILTSLRWGREALAGGPCTSSFCVETPSQYPSEPSQRNRGENAGQCRPAEIIAGPGAQPRSMSVRGSREQFLGVMKGPSPLGESPVFRTGSVRAWLIQRAIYVEAVDRGLWRWRISRT